MFCCFLVGVHDGQTFERAGRTMVLFDNERSMRGFIDNIRTLNITYTNDLRDALIERLREAGVEVNTDWQEGERVLAEQNGKARLMGSRTDKKKAEIAEILNNEVISSIQKKIVDVFVGKKNRNNISLLRDDGSVVDYQFQQGVETHAGTKHALHEHYGTRNNNFEGFEILLIPDILKSGEKQPTILENGKPGFVYRSIINGVRFTVLTEKKAGKELFDNFYTDRKNVLSELVNAKGDTDLTAHNSDENVLSDAKVQQNSEIAKIKLN